MDDDTEPFAMSKADDASYSKAVMDDSPLPAMTVDELIQTMRLKSLSVVRAGLEKTRAKRVHQFNLICEFYRGLK